MYVIGQISVGEIAKKYNLGYNYAQNVADRLELLGYIRKKSDYAYDLIQTESFIYNYIDSHLSELRPHEYDEFGLKNNGKHTLESAIKLQASHYSLIIPIYIKKFLFTIPGFFLFCLWMLFLTTATVDGRPINFIEYVFVCLITYIIPIIPINITVRIIQADIYKIKFKDFMLLPNNWLFTLYKNSREMYAILYPNKPKLFINPNLIRQEATTILEQKKELAEHYAQIANTANNENEFYQSINSCLSTLEWMAQFEKFGIFSEYDTPSEDIKTIKNNMQKSVERFNRRMNKEPLTPSYGANYDFMEGHDFEYYCADVLKGNGFSDVTVTQGSGDQGIDIIAFRDGVKYGIQCKCYSSDIGNKAVQEAFSGAKFYDCHVPVVLTNKHFTKSAIELAQKTHVLLWDREKLDEMIANLSSKQNI